MMNLAEYRRSTTRLADFLPWAALVDKGLVLNKDGSFQRTARFRGPDLDSSVPAELVAVAGRLNNALRRLGSGWAVFVEAQRYSSNAYPPSSCPDVASALVDAERRAQFEEEGAHYESAYFLTFLYLPPAEDTARAERLLYEGRERGEAAGAFEVLRGFVDRTDRVLQLVEGFMPECRWLDDGETLTYLHACVSTKLHRVRVPEIPMYLDALVADEPLTGGLEPMLGTAHLRVLTIVGFPTATTPGILDDLNRLAFPYRWATRAIMLDKADATKLLTRIRRQWFAKRKSVAAILKEVMTNEASSLIDTDANNKAIDADAALQELGSDLIGEAFVTATITVWDESPRIADERLRLVEKVTRTRLHLHGGDRQRGRGLAGLVAGPCLRQRPPAPGFDPKPRPYDPTVRGLGRAGEGRSSRCAAAVLRADGRINAVPLLSPRRGRRTYAGGRSNRRGQISAARADGAAIPSVSRLPGLCL
jgi:type IV secretion system protein TrbE